MQITLNISWPCFKCQQIFTNQDLINTNYQLTLLPDIAFQHLVCPEKTKTNSETLKNCFFGAVPKDFPPHDLNLNINL